MFTDEDLDEDGNAERILEIMCVLLTTSMWVMLAPSRPKRPHGAAGNALQVNALQVMLLQK